MRLVVMGTGPFAVPMFEALLASEHRVVALVTRPTAVVQTRGKSRPAPTPMRDVAEAHDLPCFAPEDVNAADFREQLASLHSDLFVVCDFGQILSAETLSSVPLGGVNLHASLLPKYRGAAPVNWAIWQGENETGVTVLHMTTRLDAGPCLAQVKTAIGPDETAAELEARLAQLGVEPVRDAIAQLEHWDRHAPLGARQDKSLATRAPRLKKSDGQIDWTRPAVEIYRQFRALQPWPGLFTHRRSPGSAPLRVILEKIAVAPHAVAQEPRHVAQGPGHVVVSDGQRLIVAAGQDAIAIHRLQPAGRRTMETAEFLRGHPISVGDTFGDASDGRAGLAHWTSHGTMR